ncbi:hypothetical protein GGR50DRAFT_381524 [Xylaria sp. CBS 124048]|nr:hypothetical protein GGR50DRAFT_381524 [Xylaria sp. CBS 124048]
METSEFTDIDNADPEDFFTGLPDSHEGASPAGSSEASEPSDAPPPRADLFSIPENIRAIRQQIFEAKGETHYSHSTFEEYWRYCDNIWTPSGKQYTRKDGCVTRHYRCILHAKHPRVRDETKGERNKKSRVPVGCPAAAKKTVLSNGSIIWGPAGRSSHNHDLNKIDGTRRSSFLRTAVRQEAMRGLPPSVTLRTMLGDNGKDLAVQNAMESIGGQFLTRQDVINAQTAYRRAHPDMRLIPQDPSIRPAPEPPRAAAQVGGLLATATATATAPAPRRFPLNWNLEEAALAAGLIQQRGERRDEFTRIYREAENNEDVTIARVLFWNKDVTMDGIPPYEYRNIFTLATQARRGNIIPNILNTPQKVYNLLRFCGTVDAALDRVETLVAESERRRLNMG